MITVMIFGLPEMDENAQRSLYRNCVAALCLQRAWDFTEKDLIFHFFPAAGFCINRSRVISITVEGLSVKSRNGSRNLFARVLGAKIAEFSPDAFIQVRVHPIDQKEGSWSSEQKVDVGRAIRQVERQLPGISHEYIDRR